MAATVVLLAVLMACAPVGTRELHEVVVANPDGVTRIGYAYGSAEELPLREAEHELGASVADAAEDRPWAVAGARLVDGEPFLRTSYDRELAPPLQVARIPLTTDLRVRTHQALSRAYYFDGQRWFSLGRDLPAGRTLTVAPRAAPGALRGAGDLTPAEADAMAAAVGAEGRPAAVGFLADPFQRSSNGGAGEGDGDGDGADPDGGDGGDDPALTPRPADGLDAYRFTTVWVQEGVEVDASAYTPPPRTTVHEMVARGDQGNDPGRDRFVLIRSEDRLRSFWSEVHARALTPPALPEARFGREALLGVRLGQRPSGGHGIDIERVERDGEELYVDLRLTEPAEDALASTVITTPWVLVRVLGGDARVAWFRDAEDGALFAVARAEQGDGR